MIFIPVIIDHDEKPDSMLSWIRANIPRDNYRLRVNQNRSHYTGITMTDEDATFFMLTFDINNHNAQISSNVIRLQVV